MSQSPIINPTNHELLAITGQYRQPIAVPSASGYTPILDRYTASASGLLLPTVAAVPAPKPVPIALDLFCGAGGFSLGFTQAGFHVAAACEHDYWCMQTYLCNLGGPETRIVALEDAARAVLDKAIKKGFASTEKRTMTQGLPIERQPDGSYRMPEAGSGHRATTPGVLPCDVFYFGDVRALTGAQVLSDLHLEHGDLDCIIGGPPCQGFSQAGRRDVMDPRNSLVFEYARLVVETQPKFFCLENVPQLATMITPEGASVVDAFCQALSAGGYATYDALKRSMAGMAGARAGARRGSAKQSTKTAEPEPSKENAQPRQGSLFEAAV